MPDRAARACPRPRCPKVQPCPTHHKRPWAHSTSRHERGYGSAWDRLRLAILERDAYHCGYCGSYAQTVDHRIPKAQGGTDDEDNLVAACTHCQGSKAGHEGAAGRVKTRASADPVYPSPASAGPVVNQNARTRFFVGSRK
jgi:5-methylcytosine-specific restriction protein A